MSTQRPLVVTDDRELLDEVLGLAVIADVETTVAVDLAGAQPFWRDAPLVLLDSRLVPFLASYGLPPRGNLAVLYLGAVPTALQSDIVQSGADMVLALPASRDVLVERLAATRHAEAERGRLIGVVSGSGGAGATLVAIALALSAARRRNVTWLVDLDPAAGGLDLQLSLEAEHGLRWPELQAASGPLSSDALRLAVPELGGVHVLSCDCDQADVPAEAASAVLRAIKRDGATGIVDLPRQDSAARAIALGLLDEVLLVVTNEVRAVAAARRLAAQVAGTGILARVAVRSVPRIVGLRMSNIESALGLPVVGELRTDLGLATALTEGRPPSEKRTGLGRICSAVLDGDTLLVAAT